ncbi:aldehyde dehydrogenase (NADP(+)) [Niveispirillum cyanobacteriorum]|uniref:2,5-dioxovalerate dehydrogenase n=1 Tax=Niveispirillum cyanobacteriorum TaxID=1612173 RepID=A0A2K9NHS2_9PROT|nr:aldehyde dehydrogenase (NADP(+)) [Niveispirillum cyanobacteriorum]AUN32640.1 aldehyde dehydrogenase (NADP(+)) [Niveispirillum cyanobacteriorum]GGE82871.1 2,5-dioxovalerate dehydrogenase [Niveispirillum cyanobacteriorum]
MSVSGEMILAGRPTRGEGAPFAASNPATGSAIAPDFPTATRDDLERACAAADDALAPFRALGPADRALFLDRIAEELAADANAIVERAMAETGLPRPRLEGELARTMNQLRLFGRVLREGAYLDIRVNKALPDRTPPRPDIRLSMVPVGPVAVFGASNFPLAFSVAGGDTASALAAGCPVVVKAHSSHPGTSELVAKAVARAAAACGLPDGVFSMLFGNGADIGAGLVADPRIQAVGFTGSRAGGTALIAIAQARPQPIPVYAEMSSINPVLLLSGALEQRGEAIGKAFAAALTLGAGQFCTNPGLLLAVEGQGLDSFVSSAAAAIRATTPATMLNRGIHRAYCAGVRRLASHPAVTPLAQGVSGDGWVCQTALFTVSARDFLAHPELHEEVFGACSLLVRCRDAVELRTVLAALEGQLTVAIHAEGADDQAQAAWLLPLVERKAGRILFDGFGTGVEVCDAMVHGGPFPATSDVRTTSVGSLAIARFLRPVCYQNTPDTLLPAELRDANPLNLPRTCR